MKIQVSAAYICFALGVTLATALTFVEVPCPIDKGTGVIAGVIRGLKITGVEGKLIDFRSISTGCGYDWEKYKANLSRNLPQELPAYHIGVPEKYSRATFEDIFAVLQGELY